VNDAPEYGTSLDVVLLAAGMSRRFGSSKLMADVAGKRVLEIALAQLLDLRAGRLIVVVGPESVIELPGLRNPAVTIARNAKPAAGLSSSIRIGLRGVGPGADGVMLCLADQVAVSADDYRRLVEAWRARPEAPAAAFYREQLGAPAIFPRSWFGDLRALAGDRGAGALLRSQRGSVVAVDMPVAEFDIDTPADLDRYRRQRSR